MSTQELEQIKHRMKDVQQMLAERESRLDSDPTNFGLQLTIGSLRSHFDDLHRQFALLEAENAHELIDFRLIGSQVSDGTIRLGLLGKIAGPLSDVLSSIALNLRCLNDGAVKLEQIKRFLDVRLIALGAGSTHLYLAANASTDLAGSCLLHDSLGQLFGLLNSDHEDFFEVIHAMGAKAARSAEALLKALEAEEVTAELLWTSPNEVSFYWEGRSDRISQLRAWLEHVEERQTEKVELCGAVALLSDVARIEIREDGKTSRTKIKYHKDKLPLIENLKVGQQIIAEVEKISFFDRATQRLITRYNLLTISQ